MTDLNTAIALQQGFEVFYNSQFDITSLIDKNKKKIIENLAGKHKLSHFVKFIDYEHDARMYMALFEEMVNENKDCHVQLFWNPGRKNFVCRIIEDLEEDGPRDFDAESNDKGTAICLCYCKLKGIEVVG